MLTDRLDLHRSAGQQQITVNHVTVNHVTVNAERHRWRHQSSTEARRTGEIKDQAPCSRPMAGSPFASGPHLSSSRVLELAPVWRLGTSRRSVPSSQEFACCPTSSNEGCTRPPRLDRPEWSRIGCGAPMVLLVNAGLMFAPAAHGGVLFPGVMPLMGAVLATIFLKETFTRRKGAGLVLIVLGANAIVRATGGTPATRRSTDCDRRPATTGRKDSIRGLQEGR